MHTLSAAIEMDKLDANLEQQFDLNLIEAVKMNPVIYDRSHYNYKHFVRKAQTWKQIAETLGVSGKWNFSVVKRVSEGCNQPISCVASEIEYWPRRQLRQLAPSSSQQID